MNLGIFFSPGESLKLLKVTGQEIRFINLYLKKYSKNFEKVYVFSYANEGRKINNNIFIVPNTTNLHRLLYGVFLPLIHKREINDCNVIRGFGLASAVSSLFLRKPFVFNWAYEYKDFVKIERKPLYIPFYLLLEKIAFFKSKAVFVATKNKIEKLKRKKFVYLPNGVDLNLFTERLRLFKNSKQLQGGMVYVGRLEKQKNLFFLLDAVSKLTQKHRAITFIGSGSQEQGLKKYATFKKVNLKILPPVKSSKLPVLLNNFSVFTLPSLAEGSPKVLLEAMALGLVPVVTDFSTARDIIKDGFNGYITSYNTHDYARNLQSILDSDIQYSRFSKNSVQTIKNKFNLTQLIAKEIKVLKEVSQ